MPKAYWITCYREIKDPDKVAAYAKLARSGARAIRRALSLRGTGKATYEAGRRSAP